MPVTVRKQASNITSESAFSYHVVTSASELGVNPEDIIGVTLSNWSGLDVNVIPYCSSSGNVGIVCESSGNIGMIELLISIIPS